jgi:peroxiredoxin
MTMTALPNDVAARLVGSRVPVLALRSFVGELSLRMVRWQACAFYFYPGGGPPGTGMTPWDREDRAQHRGYASLQEALAECGVAPVGVSGESRSRQGLAYKDLGVRHALFSDPELKLASLLDLPTFTAGGRQFYARLTLLCRPPDGIVQRAFYPVGEPERDASRVLAWLRSQQGSS